ncbi:MAG: UDP-N-acetylenolpyruvoylglucosamine reductase, partial [Candidatus Spechtbacteria bacterium RIFCSPLOWO2_01_FULL_46_10]
MIQLQQHINLAPYTTYKIGGPARWFARVESEEDVAEAVRWAHRKRVPYFVLGGGSNILVSDSGYNGLVILIRDMRYEIRDMTLRASAGVHMQDLVADTTERGLAGLEWAGGLPGTLGGAIRGNAGAFGGEIKNTLKSVRAFTREGNFRDFSPNECDFSYRTSIFKEQSGYVVFSATLALKEGNAQELKACAAEHIAWRRTKHPMEHGNCGSVFTSRYVADLPAGFFEKYPDAQRAVREDQLATAWLIDKAHLKNMRVGDAEVSDKHPNFLVNHGSARAEDVAMLACIVKSRILQQFGIQL